MSSSIENLNKVFENRIRLGLMSSLVVNDALDFNSLKGLLGTTDGNLASHANALEEEGYVKVKKSFRGRKPLTTYSATAAGRRAFAEHVDALAQLLNIPK
ncbi:MAG: transcriptional regulator [Bacteroidetes bacterium]|nr:transcriptional regulator [Bacteroidota bacterium]MCW5894137.1 transcriptional regulator [Bacteroidota bacterium]